MRPVPLALVLLCLAPFARADEPAPRPPNIVVLFADDAGYADFGFMPDAAPDMAALTPHIDSIAQAGVRFTSAYMAGCVCSPSRAGLMTGCHPCRFGHEQNIPPGYMQGGLDLEHETVADRLRALGYATALVGKWHLGYPPAYHPNQRGFGHFVGLLQGARSYFPYEEPTPHQVIQVNGEPTPERGYVTDRFGRAAVEFIAKNKERPFLLFVSFTAPHGPLEPKSEVLAALEAIPRGKRRRYAGLVKSLDENVGLVLEALAANGLEDRTLVVFTNDNGGQTQTGAVNAPLRGRKGQLLEGGIRVPMCLRWPGRVKPGGTIDAPVSSLDLFPTFVAAAGGAPAKDGTLEGVSLVPLLAGEATLPERSLFWRQGGSKGEIAMRRGRWKLHVPDRRAGVVPSLYDLEGDVGEASDRAVEQPERVKAMREALAAWEAGCVEPRWGRR